MKHTYMILAATSLVSICSTAVDGAFRGLQSFDTLDLDNEQRRENFNINIGSNQRLLSQSQASQHGRKIKRNKWRNKRKKNRKPWQEDKSNSNKRNRRRSRKSKSKSKTDQDQVCSNKTRIICDDRGKKLLVCQHKDGDTKSICMKVNKVHDHLKSHRKDYCGRCIDEGSTATASTSSISKNKIQPQAQPSPSKSEKQAPPTPPPSLPNPTSAKANKALSSPMPPLSKHPSKSEKQPSKSKSSKALCPTTAISAKASKNVGPTDSPSPSKSKSSKAICGPTPTISPTYDPAQYVAPCIAVINEWGNNDYSAEWAEFRTRFPMRPFCLLLTPDSGNNPNPLPNGFDLDTVNNLDGVDRTIIEPATFDNGNPALASDWTSLCDLGSITSTDIDFVGLFVDNSGSMLVSDVQAALDNFEADMASKGIQIRRVYNGFERWIDPFLGALAP